MNIDSLLKEIEMCRAEMISLSQSHEMTDEIVIHSSQKLDILLNQYQRENMQDKCSAFNSAKR